MARCEACPSAPTGLFCPIGYEHTSEDRVKLHVHATSEVDADRVDQAKAKASHSGGLMGMSTYRIRKIREKGGKEEKATLIYKRSGEDVWQLFRVQVGYQ